MQTQNPQKIFQLTFISVFVLPTAQQLQDGPPKRIKKRRRGGLIQKDAAKLLNIKNRHAVAICRADWRNKTGEAMARKWPKQPQP